ncbi:MAG TPA: hypothetical protein VM618_06470 [Acidimicrobiia bacterium]|nr:hypothetical protein [Acidimicrobiia bacterium]
MRCPHSAATPAVFEVQTATKVLRYAGRDGVFAAATTFGGRWRVTSADGTALFALAPAGPAGSDDRDVVPHGEQPVATIMRDRRHVGSWLVLDPDGGVIFRATAAEPYQVNLVDAGGVLTGQLWATATAITADFGAPSALHCVTLALPLFFATTGGLRVDPLESPAPLALNAEPLALDAPLVWD